MTTPGEIKLDLTATGVSAESDSVFTIAPAPPPPPLKVKVSLQLYLINTSGSPAWVDVSGTFVQSGVLIEGALTSAGVSVTRTSTKQDQFNRYSGGTLKATFPNLRGEWDPENLTGPWVVAGKSLLTQGPNGTPCRLIVTPPGGSPITMFTGKVSSWPPITYSGNQYSAVQMIAQDGVAQLSATNLAQLAVSGFAGQSAGQRINQILERAAWDPSNDDVDITTLNTMQATTLQSDAWSEILKASESDGGWLWMSKLNGVRYETRYYVIDATPTMTFSANAESGTLLGVVNQNANDISETSNVVKLTPDGGTEQAAMTDDAALTGYVSTDTSGLVMETGRQAMDLALFSAGEYRDVLFRPKQVVFTAKNSTPLAQWNTALNAEIFDTTQVRQVTPNIPGVTQRTLTSNVLNAGLTWMFRPANDVNTLTVDMVVAPPSDGPYVFDDAGSLFDDVAVFAY